VLPRSWHAGQLAHPLAPYSWLERAPPHLAALGDVCEAGVDLGLSPELWGHIQQQLVTRLQNLIADVGARPGQRHAVPLDGDDGGVEAAAESGAADALAHNVRACRRAGEGQGGSECVVSRGPG